MPSGEHPKVDSTIPGERMGLISVNLVSIPPENSMILKATIPMNCASFCIMELQSQSVTAEEHTHYQKEQ